jgi:uncharacterized protein
MTSQTTNSGSLPDSGPWWRYPLVWMVLAGPAAVVVAGFATLWLAIKMPDPVITGDYYRRGMEINQTLARDKSLAPAQQGRNHAATPAPGAVP